MADSVNVRVSDSGKLYPNAVVVKVGDEEIIAGRDGVSPVVTTEAIPHGNRVTITDAVGEHTFDVLDGASAYEQAVAGGYEGTEEEFAEDLAGFSDKADTAETAAAAAAQSAQSAINSASTATIEAGEAAASAATALTHRDAADSSAQSAAASATSAGNSASAAAASASAANGSATSASTSESNAANSATNAAASETAAAASESAAAASATAASNSAAAAAQSASAIEEYEHDAEAWAIGKRGGTDVDSSDATYQNNSKYYAEQAAASSSSASSAASAAAQSATDAASEAASSQSYSRSSYISSTMASGSATAAAEAQTAAETAASTAEGHATDAASSATAASGSASAAAQSATEAGNASTAATTAKEAAEDAQEAAETAAQSVSQSAAQIATNTSDISTLKSALDEVAEEATIDATASGEIAFFTDGTAKKPKSVIVEIPYTSGGISSMTMRFHRRNMLCLTGAITSNGVTYTPQSDGTVLIVGTPTGNSRYGYYGSSAYLNANNIYNFPAGNYVCFGYNMSNDIYENDVFTIYKGSTSAQIKRVGGIDTVINSTTQLGRVANQWSFSRAYNDYWKMFLGVGENLDVDDWDAPSTNHHELSATFGTTIYGGTVDLTNGTLISKFASDGTELDTRETISITVTEMPTLYDGANTIWASVVGSVVTVVYSKNVQNYVDKKVDELQDQIDTIVADNTTNTESDFCSLAMFEKIGIIGDSYAMGSLYIPNGSGATYVGTYNNLSWGKNIQRLFGNTVSFFAHGGLSTRTWLTDTTNGILALETAAQTSPCNLYWFGLGINDVGIYNDDNTYLGSITDISGHESGTAWATTFYGNVGQIIERVQASSQYSKIIISSFVGYRPKAQTAGDIALNNALQEIAEYYGLPFINLKDDKFYMSDFYSNNILGKHPIAMLYSGMALANARLFGRAVFDNQTYFKDYHMGTPEPDPEPDYTT